MKEQWLGIVIIALVVVIIGAAIIYGRSLVRTGREKKANHRLRVEDDAQREMFKVGDKVRHSSPYYGPGIAIPSLSGADDSTKTWPILPAQGPELYAMIEREARRRGKP